MTNAPQARPEEQMPPAPRLMVVELLHSEQIDSARANFRLLLRVGGAPFSTRAPEPGARKMGYNNTTAVIMVLFQ